ncbi:phosphate-selective porin OprO and OprP [Methylocaldum szegediense]|uniref:Phosphate-selective porin OprO and OprP n=2 Tax=Methylocaldum szegediense TaxID=73780 RepID=A0ABM9I4N5_9GAMM|nr:phosphate-selective porin OprO and OprP [Methylocaldum szegediense]
MRFKYLACAISVLYGGFDSNYAYALDLYMDSKTKQIYAEPGPGRVRLGSFRQVDKSEATASDTSKSFQELEQQLDKKKKELEALEARLDKKKDSIAAIERKIDTPTQSTHANSEKKWYNRLNIRGYTQLRYTQPLSGDREDLASPGDRSIQNNQNLLIRRARVVLSGDISDHLSLYLQPDFASNLAVTGATGGHFVQLRDAYADIFFDKEKTFRARVGQSKVPYGFEILQSSQNRLALDRADALNSAVRDERDIGIFLYWEPAHIRNRFKYLVSSGLKGSGDYGVIGFGVYNGQGANRFEVNDQFHLIGRFSYPFQFPNGQFFEVGASAYSGRFVPRTGNMTVNGTTVSGTEVAKSFDPSEGGIRRGYQDERVAIHAVLYPQPFGLQAEWNWGRSPELNVSRQRLETASLSGGYVQAMYKLDHFYGSWIPYAKWQHYDGAEKFSTNAPHVDLDEVEIGVEWQPIPELEFVLAYSNMNRTNVSNLEQVNADLLRMQLQWNY